MRISNQEKLSNIFAERIDMLKKIQDYIQDKNLGLYCDIEKLNSVLDKDEAAVKEYKAITDAQSLILNLTEEIKNTNDIEEIIALRKRINYYINKIKKEFKKRNVEESELDNYIESVTYLRNGISKYIRFIKRDNNIDEIVKLLDSDDEMDKKRLTKLLSNERRFNKNFSLEKVVKSTKGKGTARYTKEELDQIFNEFKKPLRDNNDKINGNGNDKENLDQLFAEENNHASVRTFSKPMDLEDTSLEVTVIDKSELDQIFMDYNEEKPKEKVTDVVFDFGDEEELHSAPVDKTILDKWLLSEIENTASKAKLPENYASTILLNEEDYEDDYLQEDRYDYLARRVKMFKKCYGVKDLYKYDNSFFGNIATFFKNVPRCLSNKKAISFMRDDYGSFYQGADLLSYIEYSKKRYSITRSFGQLFSKSYLFSRANKCLNDHNRCVDWVIDYLNNNQLEVLVPAKRIR